MLIDILTLFPKMFEGSFAESIVKRAIEKGKVEIKIHNLRDWTLDNYKTVDDKPYGGGAGMVMKVDVIDHAVHDLKLKAQNSKVKSNKKIDSVSGKLPVRNDTEKVILIDTKGEMYHQGKAQELSKIDHLILICGHYEGVDHRVHEKIADEVICIGPFVLTGAEIPAMAIVDSVVRLIPGVIRQESLTEESFGNLEPRIKNLELSKKSGKLNSNFKFQISNLDVEYPQYTRPAQYKGWKVPEVLLNGNHKEIEKWRKGKKY